MSDASNIRAALEERLAVVSGFPSAANRAYENVRFVPTDGTTWARIATNFSRTRPAVRGPSPSERWDGLFLVDVFAPENAGPGAAFDLAYAIKAAYTVDDVLTKNGVNVRIDYAELGQGISTSPWYLVPVTVAWYTYLSV